MNFEGQSSAAAVQVVAGEKGTAVAVAPAAATRPSAQASPQAGPATQPAPQVYASKPDAEGFVSLFNGQDLSGWDGDTHFWQVEDGLITANIGQDNAGTSGKSMWLIWKGGDLRDFELRVKYKVVGTNSGVNYRSKVINAKAFQVSGYQADIEDSGGRPITGSLWEDPPGRGTLANIGEKVTLGADGGKEVGTVGDPAAVVGAVNRSDWNDLVVTAVGNKLTHRVNGVTSVEVVDDSDQAAKSGVLALQMDFYFAGSTQFKDVRLKVLNGPQPRGNSPPPQCPRRRLLHAPGAAVDPATGGRRPAQRLAGPVGREAARHQRRRGRRGGPGAAAPRGVARDARGGQAGQGPGRPGAAEDTALVQAENEVRPVTGVVLGIEGDSLNFRFNDRDRKIALDRLVGSFSARASASRPTPWPESSTRRSSSPPATRCRGAGWG